MKRACWWLGLMAMWVLGSAPPVRAQAEITLMQIQNVMKILQQTQQWVDRGAKAGQMARSYQNLTEIDARMRDAPVGGPRVPSRCVGDARCERCYRPVVREIRETRWLLMKARAIYLGTKSFVDDAIAFGDSMASLPGAGLGWAVERRKIKQSYQQFVNKYNRKVDELMGRMERALRELARCEETFYGDTDWYDRYGFIYIDFLRTYYRGQ